jgi:hypothetical protein
MSILINSPEGSGNSFAKAALHNAGCSASVKHNYQLLTSGGDNIFILRNPYHCILSAMELPFLNDKSRERKVNLSHPQTSEEIDRHIKQYLNYLDNYNNEKVYALTFEFLTSNPKKFVQNVVSKFETKVYKSDFDFITEESVIKTLIKKNANRAPFRDDNPRKKINLRGEIKEYLNEDKRMEDLFSIYLQHKNILQSTKNVIQ